MIEVETRVRRIAQQYLAAFVNAQTMLKDEPAGGKNYQHMRDWIAERYRNECNPSPLQWNMGECRAVTNAVQVIIQEIVGGQ